MEQVLARDDRRVRAGLAGPGRAFGYEGLIDGGPSPSTAITRERALLLVLPRGPFEQLLNGEDAVSRVFLDVLSASWWPRSATACASTCDSRRACSGRSPLPYSPGNAVGRGRGPGWKVASRSTGSSCGTA